MKQILTIGRGLHCDIVLNDATDVVSREHATLEIDKSGKYYLVDISRNGTYVNGMRIMPNQRVQVSRGDVISFAHVQALDWNRVPRPFTIKPYLLYAAIAVGVILLGVCGWLFLADDGRIEVYGLQTSGDAYFDDFRYGQGADLEDEGVEDQEAEEAKPEAKPVKKSKPAPKAEEPKAKDSVKQEEAPAEAEAPAVQQPEQEATPADNGGSSKEDRKNDRKARRAASKRKVYDAIY